MVEREDRILDAVERVAEIERDAVVGRAVIGSGLFGERAFVEFLRDEREIHGRDRSVVNVRREPDERSELRRPLKRMRTASDECYWW